MDWILKKCCFGFSLFRLLGMLNFNPNISSNFKMNNYFNLHWDSFLYYYVIPKVSGLFKLLLPVSEWFWQLLTIFDHFWSFLNTFYHFLPSMIVPDRSWSYLTDSYRLWPKTVRPWSILNDDRRWPSGSIKKVDLELP